MQIRLKKYEVYQERKTISYTCIYLSKDERSTKHCYCSFITIDPVLFNILLMIQTVLALNLNCQKCSIGFKMAKYMADRVISNL